MTPADRRTAATAAYLRRRPRTSASECGRRGTRLRRRRRPWAAAAGRTAAACLRYRLRRNWIVVSRPKSQLQLLLGGTVGLLLADQLRLLLSQNQLRMLLVLRRNWIIDSRLKSQLKPLLEGAVGLLLADYLRLLLSRGRLHMLLVLRRNWIIVSRPTSQLEPGSIADAHEPEAQLDYC